MRSWRILLLAGVAGVCSYAQSSKSCGTPYLCIGAGAPSSAVQDAFINAYLRNGFSSLVDGPNGNVAKFGSTGLIQTFTGLGGNRTLALIKPDTSSANNVAQMQAGMYAYYSTVAVATVGYPTGDTQICPAGSVPLYTASCSWQIFSNHYALFAYSQPIESGQNFAVRDPFFSKWGPPSGSLGIGPVVSAETSVTSYSGSLATVQTFASGAIFNITSGALSGRLLAVAEPFYHVYLVGGGGAGPLGLPVTEPLALANGHSQQTFEGGVLEYDPSTGQVYSLPPVRSVVLTPSGPVQMQVGDTLAVQAALYAQDGSALTDRIVTWKTSSPAVKIQPDNFSATLTAAADGSATVTATAGGASATLIVSVVSPCCPIGEGAPSAAVKEALQAAVARNGLSGQVSGLSRVTRVGNGYVQQMQGSGTAPAAYLVALADGSTTAYVVTGVILTQFVALGGPAGTLGYPTSDATRGGRQNFQKGALAGNPARPVTGGILSKWANLGYETGAAGSPITAGSTFQTFRGTAGSLQSFQSGLIVAPTIGPLAGKGFFVTGLVLDAYTSNGGPGGDLGSPTTDIRVVNGLNQQDFEGGVIRYANGAARATVVKTPRQPIVIATPSTVFSGSTVHLVAGGFNNGAAIRISQTGQPDFQVTVSSGAYAWDVRIPDSAAAAVITVSAVDTSGGVSAKTTYAIRPLSPAFVSLQVVSGDGQIGAPGAQLSQPIVVVLQDRSGNPLPGRLVKFAASPGARIIPASATTGADGRASAVLRLPLSTGIALGTADAAQQVVTFGARSAPSALRNFPALTQAIDTPLGNGNASIRQEGALLTAAAGILRYYQTLGLLPQSNGRADPVVLNEYLKSYCATDAQGNQICDGFLSLGAAGAAQTVNLWRLGAFAGTSVDVEVAPVDPDAMRDLVAGGSPLLVALSLEGLGSHFVVATGIDSDGSLEIADPSPVFGQNNLNSYLNGFTVTDATGIPATVRGTVTGVARLVPQAPAPAAFLAAANASLAISSTAGPCGRTFQFPDTAAWQASSRADAFGTLYFQPCNGSNDAYELDIAASGPYRGVFFDLSANGRQVALSESGAASQGIVRNDSQWTLTVIPMSFSAGGVVNAADPGSPIVPGGLISIYGKGLSGATVQINGQNALVIAATPFQVNAQVPFDTATGSALVRVVSPNGSAEQSISISAVGPAIFPAGPEQAAITNQDDSLNTSSNPANRGSSIVIYGAGLGAVIPSDSPGVVSTPISVVINGEELVPAFAGLSSTTVGVYQVKVQLPESLPPGLTLPLYLKQGDVTSNTVLVAIQ